MLDELLLQSGADVPFAEARITIHTPSIVEVGLIGEENFHLGINFLNFSKEMLENKDKMALEGKADFEIFMTMMNNKEEDKFRTCCMLVLGLLFPDYTIKINDKEILLQRNDGFKSTINRINYDSFKQIISDLFCLKKKKNNVYEENGFNPADPMAEKIANKIIERRQKLNNKSGSSDKLTIYNRYISILSVGLKKDKNDLMNYSIYQLEDEYRRFIMKQNFDIYLSTSLAGATHEEEAEDWMKDIHA